MRRTLGSGRFRSACRHRPKRFACDMFIESSGSVSFAPSSRLELARILLMTIMLVSHSAVAQELMSISSSSAVPLEDDEGGRVTLSESANVRIQWSHLMRDSLWLLSVEHAFRCATEQGTRAAFGHSFIRGYLNSVGNLHGWADGDEFYVNYVGHGMEGAVGSFIFTNNDPAYNTIAVSSTARYWKAKLRGLAFSYIQSVQFEMGPISEASIGNIQAEYPQQGFVDHVITPTVGTAWVLAEDALDRVVVRRIEAHTHNQVVRILARSGMNPARSMANVMGGKLPWHRNDRPGVRTYDGTPAYSPRLVRPVAAPPGVDKFDFTVRAVGATYLRAQAARQCVGGEAVAAYRLSTEWQGLLNVGGCRALGLGSGVSGDVLDYMIGGSWKPRTSGRWIPSLQVLVGGTKATQERMDSSLKRRLEDAAKTSRAGLPKHELYSRTSEANGVALRAGAGIDVNLGRAVSVHLLGIDYSHIWGDGAVLMSRNAVRLTSGVVLRIGTW